ncbi:T9SS type A sorting domain-containing protein [Fluviicola taffensis]|uniref:Secretion system C-terminal sorting domain-containing protein n=1 Tax=Fluviicola taffensis (strain DSM 16823 / NCIMB 13979 / RW262) TaxID=755732 RepID=F2IIA9_FLUTR|nr:T9SS type A sorting domain-containing protein [Fluviicola taffensis]AEA43818.1 hypothetical protein Fluta_1831 [Fluviicola taffensis DSM 16823]
MKKIYSLLSLLLLTVSANAQVEIRESNAGAVAVGNDISGTTFTANVTDDQTYIFYFNVKNVSGSDQYLRIKVLELSAPAGWSDGVCWGAYPDDELEGQCYTAAAVNTNPWTTPNPPGVMHAQTIPDQGNGLLWPDIHVYGTGSAHYRYYVMSNQGGFAIDSFDLVVSRTLSIDDNKVAATVSAYPNPANNLLTINTTGIENGNSSVKIVDVLGKLIYNEEMSASSKKIDVSEFKNGVYILTVMDKGAIVQTRRIVVKH